MIKFIFLFIFLVISPFSQAENNKAQSSSYRLGIFPYMSPRQTVELFGPVVAEMEKVLKHPVKLESAASFPDFSLELANHSYDIALIQPFDYHKAVELYGYLPLAQLDAPLVAKLVVRDDSRYQTITDLRDTTIGLPPEQSANARMTLRALYDNKLIPDRDVKIQYFKSHDSCIQQVWIGEASACGTSSTPIQVFTQRMQAKLRSVYDTPAIPHTLFVVHPRISSADRAKLQQIMTGWSQTEAGRAMLKTLGIPGFVVPKPAEYTIMRNYDQHVTRAHAELAAPKELIFGVLPYISPRMLSDNYSLALATLSKTAGSTIHLRSATNYDNFTTAVNSGNYDIILVQPFEYTNAIKHGYFPLAGMKNKLQTFFYVLANSPYNQLTELKGKVIAMPPVNAAQSRMARKGLMNVGLTPSQDVNIIYSVNHEACLQRVLSGEAVACATADRTLPLLSKEITQEFRAIGQCPEVPGVVLMAHKRLPSSTRNHLQAEIVSWKDQVEGRKILDAIKLGDFVPVNDSEYQQLTKFE